MRVFYSTPSSPPLTATHRAVTLRWTDNSNNEDGFYIERRGYPPGDAFVREGQVLSNDTDYVDAFAANEARCYRVQAFNSVGTSGYTAEACACVQFVCNPGIVARPTVQSRPPVTSRPPVP